MRKRTRWQAHEVGTIMHLARSFDRCMANRDWCRRVRPVLDQEALLWHNQAAKNLLSLLGLGLPDEVLQGLIGHNHSLEEFGLRKGESNAPQ